MEKGRLTIQKRNLTKYNNGVLYKNLYDNLIMFRLYLHIIINF